MKTIITISSLIIGLIFHAQHAGNTVYSLNGFQLPETNIAVQPNYTFQSVIKVKGIANVKADSYTAIFSVKQMGTNAKETNAAIDSRINNALQKIKARYKIETHVDMISFVPVYTYEEQKRIFSKKTYNEVPKGFEVIKNIHIKLTNSEWLNYCIEALSEEEIYDLVRVDYFAKDLDTFKAELQTKVQTMLQSKLETFEEIMDFQDTGKTPYLYDNFKILLPVEQYQRYTAYTRDYQGVNSYGRFANSSKSMTLFYQPVLDKEFDFVINPSILEPVIQVMYEINYSVKEKVEQNQRYFILKEDGNLTEVKL